MFLGVLIAYAIRSLISARLEQPKTKPTVRKHKMSTFLCVLYSAGTNSPNRLYTNPAVPTVIPGPRIPYSERYTNRRYTNASARTPILAQNSNASCTYGLGRPYEVHHETIDSPFLHNSLPRHAGCCSLTWCSRN